MPALKRMWTVLACACILGCSAGDPTPAEKQFGLTHPVHLAGTDYYTDGGTVAFVLVGAQHDTLRGGFDGRMQTTAIGSPADGRVRFASTSPRHCYVGSKYPSEPHARLLPLWGSEERALIQLLTSVLGRKLSSDQTRRLISTTSARDLPRGVSIDLWQLVRAVDGRRQMQEALDQSLLATFEAALRDFGVVPPLGADSLVVDPASRRFLFQIHDARGKRLRVTFPAFPDSLLSPSSASTPGRPIRWCEAGGWDDRSLVTLISKALDSEPDSGPSTQSAPAPTQHQRDLFALRAQVRLRVARTLEADAKR